MLIGGHIFFYDKRMFDQELSLKKLISNVRLALNQSNTILLPYSLFGKLLYLTFKTFRSAVFF